MPRPPIALEGATGESPNYEFRSALSQMAIIVRSSSGAVIPWSAVSLLRTA
jgi:hypothetical protein